MSTLPLIVAVIAIGWLIGSFPTAQVMMRLVKHQDLRRIGAGNVTATAAMTHGSRLAGILTLAGEALKTVLCIYIAHLLVGDLWAYLLIVVAAAVGQIWCVWLRWAGGRGQTIFVTAFLVLCPLPFLLAALFFGLTLFTTKRFMLSNQIFHLITPFMLMLANLFNPALLGLGQHSWGYSILGAAFCAIFFIKQRAATDDIVQTQAWGAYSR